MLPGMVGVVEARVLINPQISADATTWDFSVNQSNKVKVYIKSASAP